MSKHLTLSDRALIEKYLALDMSFSYIARKICRAPSTVAREIKAHRLFAGTSPFVKNDCLNYNSCLRRNLCETESMYTCARRCKFCREYDCTKICRQYVSKRCPLLDKPPYVCSGCPQEKTCKKTHAYYTAHRAHAEYLNELSASRKGIRTSPERLAELNDLLLPLVSKGQSINHIFSSHSEEIALSKKTLYNYIDSNAFAVKNIDLPKKVAYRQRRPSKVLTKLEYKYRKGRTYADFTSYMNQHPKLPVVEMDTVKGARGSGKCLLTLLFREANFMLVFLLPDGTNRSVVEVFDSLTLLLGIETFRALFPVILTDNGVEFKAAHCFEFMENGTRRTRVFYCDPQASWQKGRIEKNHVLIRRILPKGTRFSFLEAEDIHLMTCHINSVAREIFENFTPFDLMTRPEHKKLLETLALSKVPPDEVLLKPALLKRRK